MNSVKVSSNVIDEMFPEGPETMMMELDEVIWIWNPSKRFRITHTFIYQI